MDTGNPIYRGCPTSNRAGTCAKLEVFNWLSDLDNILNPDELVEIRFKNTRKDYYRNVNGLSLEVGDVVAVEASPGHDIGMVSMIGDLVRRQMKRHKVTLVNGEMRKVYRKAKPIDIEKWEEAMKREHITMIKSRQIAADLKLNMKIGDVEYQGDGTKAIFYYIADDRVDFRQLIKVLAESFRIRIEMKQIGARQEAGRIGGIGPCGRELCCCSWMSSFSSVSTVAARYQEISLNPQKLAGQCSKLKCCLNYEVDSYIDEQKSFPPRIKLETQEGAYHYIKSDVFKRTYWYTLDSNHPTGQIGLTVDRVQQIINLNRKGSRPEKLVEFKEQSMNIEKASNDYGNVVGQDSLTRFDKPKDDHRKNRRHNKRFSKPADIQANPGQNRNNPNQARTDQGGPRTDQGGPRNNQNRHPRNNDRRNRRPDNNNPTNQ
jgi:cell fate regulator YaaT (PSP1 superfamily)